MICLLLLLIFIVVVQYGDGAVNTTDENSSIFCLIWKQGIWAANKNDNTILQHNPPLFNWGCWLTQVDLYTGCKMVVCVGVVIVVAVVVVLKTVCCYWLSFCKSTKISPLRDRSAHMLVCMQTHQFISNFSNECGLTQMIFSFHLFWICTRL